MVLFKKRTTNCSDTSAWSHGASVTFVIRNYRAVANVTMHNTGARIRGENRVGNCSILFLPATKKEYILHIKTRVFYKIANLKQLLGGPAMIS